jgi:hypothetical protein
MSHTTIGRWKQVHLSNQPDFEVLFTGYLLQFADVGGYLSEVEPGV